MKILKNKRTISAVLYLIIFIFLFQYLRNVEFDKLSSLNINYFYFLIASAIGLSSRYWGVYIWRTILTDLGALKLPSFNILGAVYAKAWLGRYIPGKVTWIAGKIYFASNYGISKKRLFTASILEGALQIVVIFVISLIFLAIDSRLNVIPDGARIILFLLGVIGLVVLLPSFFNKFISIVLRILKKSRYDSTELQTNNKAVWTAIGLFIVSYFLNGASFFFIVQSIYPVEAQNFFFLVAAFNIAGAIGIASLVTPSGLGVRESVQLILLPIILPLEIALVVTILSRLWSVLIDILFFGIAQSIYKLRVT